jgi:hypothetical protein
MDMSMVIIILFIIGCVIAYKAFVTEDQRQKRIYGLIALAIGGILYALRSYVPH